MICENPTMRGLVESIIPRSVFFPLGVKGTGVIRHVTRDLYNVLKNLKAIVTISSQAVRVSNCNDLYQQTSSIQTARKPPEKKER